MRHATSILAGLAALLPNLTLAQGIADRVWTGGPVVTVDAGNTVVEGIAVRDGRILAVGSEADIMKHVGPQTEVTDLAGRR